MKPIWSMPPYNCWVPTWGSIFLSVSQSRSLLSCYWRMWMSAMLTNPCFLWFYLSRKFGAEMWNFLGEWGCVRNMLFAVSDKYPMFYPSCSLKEQPKFCRVCLRSYCLTSQKFQLFWSHSPVLGWIGPSLWWCSALLWCRAELCLLPSSSHFQGTRKAECKSASEKRDRPEIGTGE